VVWQGRVGDHSPYADPEAPCAGIFEARLALLSVARSNYRFYNRSIGFIRGPVSQL